MLRSISFIATLVILFTLLVPFARAQNDTGSGDRRVVLSDQTGSYSLGIYVDYLEDPDGELALTDVSSPEMDPLFVSNTDETLSLGVTRSTIWIRILIDDQSQVIPYWLLDVSFATLEYVDLYLPTVAGAYQVQRSGLLIPDAEQDIQDNHYIFRLPHGSHPDKPIYLRFATTNSMVIPLTLWSADAFLQNARRADLRWGIFLGILLIMATYNGLLFLSLRDRNYLFLLLYILAVLLQNALSDGRLKDWLPAQLGYQYHYLSPAIGLTTLPLLLLFSTSFLKIKELAPRWYQVVLGLFALLFLQAMLVFFVDRYLFATLSLILALPALCVVLISGILAWRQGYRPARYFLLAILIPLILAFGIPLSRLGLLPIYSIYYTGAQFGNAALLTLLSFALADRITFYRIQSEEAGEQTRVAQALYQSVVDKEALFICRFTEDGILTFVNRAFCKYFGGSLEGFLGSNFQSVLLKSELPYLRAELAKITPQNPTHVIENQIINHSGEIHWQRWTVQGFFEDRGNLLEYQATGADITEQKQIDEQLARYRENLEELVAERTRQERHQRAIAESLQTSASVLNSDLNQESVLTKILEQLPEVIPLDSAAIFFQDGEYLALYDTTDASQYDLGLKIALASRQDPAVRVFIERRSLFFLDAETDPDGVFVETHCCARSWMGTPLLSSGDVIGVLTVSSAEPGLYDETTLPVLEAFADHAAIAITNARLYREARYAAALEERNRLANDLHDSVTQTLFSASIIAQALPLQWEQDQAGARSNLKRLHDLTRGVLAEMRLLLYELRSGSIQQIPLRTLVKNLCEAYQAKTYVRVQEKLVDQGAPEPPVEVKEYFYRITQEALNNIAKHSRTSQVEVILEQTAAGIWLCIRDDGQGFDPQQVEPGHLGLQIMRERAAGIQASLQIESQPGAGTMISSQWTRVV